MKRNISGQRICVARMMRHPRMSQAELVAQLSTKYQIDMSVNTLSKLENGDRYITDMELVAISKILQVSTAWLLGETNVPGEQT